jgi:phage terminase large subunit
VFENVQLRKISDDEIKQFDRCVRGQDWGFYPDPAHHSMVHYDAARMTLYIFGEYRAWKTSNRAVYDELVRRGLKNDELIIADSAEPKSIADFWEYGASCRGAEKGPESVKYSIKWLQSIAAIVIDPERCPYTAQEFLEYEYEQDADGNYISEYPDHNNHAIDSVRYATNMIWAKKAAQHAPSIWR